MMGYHLASYGKTIEYLNDIIKNTINDSNYFNTSTEREATRDVQIFVS